MTRCARERRVFFVEEPEFHEGVSPHLHTEVTDGVTVAVPQLPTGLSVEDTLAQQRTLLNQLIALHRIHNYALWYYTPMALSFSDHLSPRGVIYDCMDELSAFKNAPEALQRQETALLRRAALVLTGGQSLYEAKKHLHHNIHAFPSSVDVAHFAQARRLMVAPPDQAAIPRPRLGFFGVIDERMDLELLDGVAAARPDWHLVMLGPVVKIDPVSLPQRPNIHYLGAKLYQDLPRYLTGWDVALLPFARNDATRFISPTKTPEYMAAGKPVVSTSIRDVVRPFGHQGLVRIADDVPAFVQACVEAMQEDAVRRTTLADAFLRQTSWDGTWNRIRLLMEDVLNTHDPTTSSTSGTDAAAVV